MRPTVSFSGKNNLITEKHTIEDNMKHDNVVYNIVLKLFLFMMLITGWHGNRYNANNVAIGENIRRLYATFLFAKKLRMMQTITHA